MKYHTLLVSVLCVCLYEYACTGVSDRTRKILGGVDVSTLFSSHCDLPKPELVGAAIVVSLLSTFERLVSTLCKTLATHTHMGQSAEQVSHLSDLIQNH